MTGQPAGPGRPAVSYDDVLAAARRVFGVAHRTPVLRSRRLDEQLGASVFVKCENFQRAGAFKFRGAYNALARLNDAARADGVVAYSSGNHAQAVALAARLLQMPATIVMPHDAPASKVAATKGYGATVVGYDRYRQDREQLGAELAERDGLTLIPPYDHPDIIAGQGTAADELLDEAGELDVLLVPLGGGGLLAGSLLAAGARAPRCDVYGVEPAAGDDGLQSLRAGEIVHIDTPRTIADGAQTQHLGVYTFAIIARRVADVLTATDAELVQAMRWVASTLKLVVEPTGVLGLAAAFAQSERWRDRRVGVIISGGNVDLDRYASLLAGD